MNPHILMVLDHLANPDKYTKEQLKSNALAAFASTFAADAFAAAADAFAAAAAYNASTLAANAASALASALADADALAAYVADVVVDVEYWLNEYFERTGENKQDYIKELNK